MYVTLMLKQEKTEALLRSHVLWPLLVFIGVSFALELAGIDLGVADWIYHWSGDTWSLQDSWVTRELIHDGGRTLIGVMIVVVILLYGGTWLFPALRTSRRGLSYLVVSTLTAALVINVLKQITHVYCPWDLQRYGGQFAYTGMFDFDSWSTRQGACFPAGHASAGFAWFGLYYLAREYRSGWQWPIFGCVMLLGLVFGTGQQLRGAHFISHDWWTAGLCWFIATGFYLLFFGARESREKLQWLLL